MKCDSCGKETDFEQGFIKERKSFRSSFRTLCPTCWTRRRFALEGWVQIAVLALGILGYLLLWLKPELDSGRELTTMFLINLFLILIILPHELGHAIAARLLGWRVFAVVVGLGKQVFKFRLFNIIFSFHWLPVGGITQVAPIDARWFRLKRFLIFLAGPAVNAAIAAIILLACWTQLREFGYLGLPRVARLCFWANLWVLAFNLWPHHSKTLNMATDGKQLLKTFTRKPKEMNDLLAARFAVEAVFCRDELKDLQRALDWCHKGLALYPSNFSLLNVSGMLSLDQQQYNEAREIFQRLLPQVSKPSQQRYLVLNNIAYADAIICDPALLPEADAYSKEAYNGAPWNPSIIGTRGTVLVAMAQYEDGIKLLAESIEKAHTPRSKSENACHLVIAHVRNGQLGTAAKYLKLAKQLDPRCPLIGRAEQEYNSKTAQTSQIFHQ
jgi:tetratricopeptide (TPR) repeat protein